jgi:ActR/RegA family two-component response regulator
MTDAKDEYKEFSLLIVDDEEAARYGMRRALASFGCAIEEAGSVDEAQSQSRIFAGAARAKLRHAARHPHHGARLGAHGGRGDEGGRV